MGTAGNSVDATKAQAREDTTEHLGLGDTLKAGQR